MIKSSTSIMRRCICHDYSLQAYNGNKTIKRRSIKILNCVKKLVINYNVEEERFYNFKQNIGHFYIHIPRNKLF